MKLFVGIGLIIAAELLGAISFSMLSGRNKTSTETPDNSSSKIVFVTPPSPIVATTPAVPQTQNVLHNNTSPRTINLEINAADTLTLSGEVGENAEKLADTIDDLPPSNKPIYLLIDSPGGSVLEGAKLVSSIESSRRPIYTVCESICASMAAIIHQYGAKRYMIKRSVLMFHDAAGGAQGYIPQMLSMLNMIDRYTHKMDAYIAKRSGQTPEEFALKLGAHNIWIDSEDSLDQHYSDGTIALHMNGRGSLLNTLFSSPEGKIRDFSDIKD